MKRLVTVLCILVSIAHASVAQTPSTDIVFEERVFNFDTIQEARGKVMHTFVFTNNGKSPVTIDDVNTGCGCISKTITKGPVKPGAKGKVTIVFDPAYKSGFFSKEIVVLTNGGRNYNRVWIEGVIKPAEHPITDDYPYNFGNGLYLRLKVMALGYLKPGETRQLELHYANTTNQEMLLNFEATGKKEGLRFQSPGKLKPKARGVMMITYTMPAPGREDMIIPVQPYVNGKKIRTTVDVKVLSEYKRVKGSL